MVALKRLAVGMLLALVAVGDATAQCIFSNGEITNPTAPGCGDRQLTFAESNPANDPDIVSLGYPVPVPVPSPVPVDGFRAYASLLAGHQDMMLNQAEVTGSVIGQTIAGEDIWAYRIGTGGETTVFGTPKGSVLINGGIHAREWQSPEVLSEVFERLVAGRADGGTVQYLVDNLAVFLVPVLNVDGFLQTQAFPDRATADPAQPRDGRFRRKNLQVPAGGTVDADLASVEDNFHGVDLNRNHPVGFGRRIGNSLVRSLIYAGSSPHSEPETQALLAAAALAGTGRLRLYIDVHSFSQIYFTPQTSNQARNQNTLRLANAMRAVTNNKYRYSADPPESDIGTTASYFAVTHQVPAWTLETEPLNGSQDYGGVAYGHGGFVAPDSAIARIRDELARTLLLGFYHQAGPPAVIAAEIRDETGQLVWGVTRTGSGVTRSETVDADEPLAPGQAYTLWVAFDKPMRWRDGGAVAQYAGQDIMLVPAVGLEYRSGDANTVVPITVGADAWLDTPGPGPGGYLNYRDDAFAVEFTVPVDAPATATEALITVSTTDMTGLHLDVDASTVARWANGSWSGYEDSAGAQSVQASGADCSLRLWIGSGTRGSHTLACAERAPATPPPPTNPSRSGGAGHVGWFFLLGLIALSFHPISGRTAWNIRATPNARSSEETNAMVVAPRWRRAPRKGLH